MNKKENFSNPELKINVNYWVKYTLSKLLFKVKQFLVVFKTTIQTGSCNLCSSEKISKIG